MSERKPTEEQQAIISSARESEASLCVNADAGTGKTSTLEMMAPGLRQRSVVALAFNKINASEMQERLPDWCKAQTLNATGHRALASALGGVKVDARKLWTLVKDNTSIHFTQRDDVVKLAQNAMQAGLVPTGFKVEGLLPDTFTNWQMLSRDSTPDIQTIEHARDLLMQSIKVGIRGTISFDDQIYLSVFFTPGSYPKFHTVLVDESQDLSPMNHEQLKLMRPQRLIVVGDRKQAIYAWRGADARSMDSMKLLASDWIDLPLHVTFRCPKLVVARQQQHAPGYRAHEANAQGVVKTFGQSWEWSEIPALAADMLTTPNGSSGHATLAVLCRNNAPLIALALKLLAQRIPAKVLGKDIAANLVALSRKIARDDCTPQASLLAKINDWRTTECSKAEAMGDDSKVDNIFDKAEALCAVAASCRDAGELRSVLTSMFSDESNGHVLLSTIHKAKGREWNVVLHLDPARCPSRFAKTDVAKEQERNLLYVAETRTRHTLAMANLESFQ